MKNTVLQRTEKRSATRFNNMNQPKYEDIYEYENALAAFNEVAKGRSEKVSWITFSLDKSAIICHAIEDLIWETYIPGKVTQFDIKDPKPRHIIAPRLYDRLIHHMLIRVTLPVFESYFHRASFACRKGKERFTFDVRFTDGSESTLSLAAGKDYPVEAMPAEVHRLAERILTASGKKIEKLSSRQTLGRGTIYGAKYYSGLMRKALGKWSNFFVVSIDIKSYFKSINHRVLIVILNKLFEDKRIVGLFTKIIDAIDEGLPIGFLPSQHEANLLGTIFDYFITDILGQSIYIRYMDDMRILVHTRDDAEAVLQAVDELATNKLGLTLSEKKTTIKRFKGSDVFCGFKVCPHHLQAKTSTIKRHERRCLKKEKLYLEGNLSLDKLDITIQAAETYLAITDAKSSKIASLRKRFQSYSQFCINTNESIE